MCPLTHTSKAAVLYTFCSALYASIHACALRCAKNSRRRMALQNVAFTSQEYMKSLSYAYVVAVASDLIMGQLCLQQFKAYRCTSDEHYVACNEMQFSV